MFRSVRPQFKALPDNPTPDAAVKFRHDYAKGHIQLSGLFRDVAAYLPDGRNGSVFGWGVNLTGAQKLGADTFVYQGAYGAGMERYVNDTSGLGIDAQPTDAARPHLEAVPLTAIYGGYQHYWSEQVAFIGGLRLCPDAKTPTSSQAPRITRAITARPTLSGIRSVH